MSHPYHTFVSAIAATVDNGKTLPCGGFASVATPSDPKGRRILIFAPHPDDECIIGGLPLRLLRQQKARVGVVAVTQGSNPARQAPRLMEQRHACDFLGWDLITTKPGGLLEITPAGRAKEPALWAEAVGIIAEILRREQPELICFPHDKDANPSHIGTHLLMLDALASLPDFRCHVLETEFWAANESPNLMVESSAKDLADLVAAISFHVGEVARNPYHLTLPAWMLDNVRRGELVIAQGAAVPDFKFATLYRLRKWNGQDLSDLFQGGRIITAENDLSDLLI